LPPCLCARLDCLGAQAIAGFSALQLNFLFFCKKLSCKALIPFIGVSALPLNFCDKKQEKFHPTLETINGKEL
jgi:hypothetical protein